MKNNHLYCFITSFALFFCLSFGQLPAAFGHIQQTSNSCETIVNKKAAINERVDELFDSYFKIRDWRVDGNEAFHMAYEPPAPIFLMKKIRQIWKRVYKIELPPRNPIHIQYSPKSTVLDAILGLTSPSDLVAWIGEKPPSFQGRDSIANRRITSKTSDAKLVVITDINDPTVNVANEVEKVRSQNPTPYILILRQFEDASTSFLSLNDPNIIESFVFNSLSQVAQNFFVISSGGVILEKMVGAAEKRGSWFGKLDLFEAREKINSVLAKFPILPQNEAIHRYQGNSVQEENSAETEVEDSKRISSFTSLFEGYRQRNLGTSFALGIGQPFIQLKKNQLHAIFRNNSGVNRLTSTEKMKDAITHFYKKELDVHVGEKEIHISEGVSGSVFDILSTLPKGSKVAIPSIAYATYKNIILDLGLVPEVFWQSNKTFENYQPSADVKLLLVNFPHNPTGETLTSETQSKLRQYAEQGIVVVNDLSYARFTYLDKNILSVFGEPSHPNLVEIFSFSKDFGLPEIRVGAIIGHSSIVERIRRKGVLSGSNVTSFKIGVAADVLNSYDKIFITSNLEMNLRLEAVLDFLDALEWPVDQIIHPEAGLNVMATLPPDVSSMVFANQLWKIAQVMFFPGEFFSEPGGLIPQFLRISLSEHSSRLRDLLKRAEELGLTYEYVLNAARMYQQQVSSEMKFSDIEDDRFYSIYNSNTNNLEDMTYPLQQAFQFMRNQFASHNGKKALKFLDREQLSIHPKNTDYLVMSRLGSSEPSMFGMVIRRGDVELPFEKHFENFAWSEHGDPQNAFEVGRLAGDETAGTLRRIPNYLLYYFSRKYGDIKSIPEDLTLWGWTIKPELARTYQLLGFKVIEESENQFGRPQWLVKMDKATLMRRGQR